MENIYHLSMRSCASFSADCNINSRNTLCVWVSPHPSLEASSSPGLGGGWGGWGVGGRGWGAAGMHPKLRDLVVTAPSQPARRRYSGLWAQGQKTNKQTNKCPRATLYCFKFQRTIYLKFYIQYSTDTCFRKPSQNVI